MNVFASKLKTLIVMLLVIFLSYTTQVYSIIGYSPDFETIYRVKRGDTLSDIAYRFYPSSHRNRGAHWVHIYAFCLEKAYINPKIQPVIPYGKFDAYVDIKEGQKLAIPFFENEYPPVDEVFEEYSIILKNSEEELKSDVDILEDPKVDFRELEEEVKSKQLAIDKSVYDPIAKSYYVEINGELVPLKDISMTDVTIDFEDFKTKMQELFLSAIPKDELSNTDEESKSEDDINYTEIIDIHNNKNDKVKEENVNVKSYPFSYDSMISDRAFVKVEISPRIVIAINRKNE